MKKYLYTLVLLCCNLFLLAQEYDGTPVVPTSAPLSSTPPPTVNTPTGDSNEVGITEGQLSVSLTGAANYNIPIAVPPGINGVMPQISLAYSSQAGNGMAGYSWNITGVSSISRIPSTNFHDGVIDAVDFDELDRFAIDGQRLILKSGVYGGNGATYETENFSNLKITSYGVSSFGANYGPQSFKVEYPDGSYAVYGNTNQARTINNWSINEWQNPQGIKLFYFYENISNSLFIAVIVYGTDNSEEAINKVYFNYEARERREQGFIGGVNVSQNLILKNITVIANGIVFRNYELKHDTTSLGYQRLTSITEKTAGNLNYNPTVFSYDTTNNSDLFNAAYPVTINLSGRDFTNTSNVTGDFDGDGKLDYVLYPTTGVNAKSEFHLFRNIVTGIIAPYNAISKDTSYFESIFASTWLTSDNKVSPKQGITIAMKTGSDSMAYSTYSYGSNGLQIEYSKTITLPYQSRNGCTYSPTPGNCAQAYTFVNAKTTNLKSYSGDFNGDGLSDVIAITNTNNQDVYCTYCYMPNDYCSTPGTCYNAPVTTTTSNRAFFIDLKRNATISSYDLGKIGGFYEDTRVEVADFDGDGKSDLYFINNGYVSVYTLDSNYQFSLVGSISSLGIRTDRPILFGDYNGDGKIDFCIPEAIDSYIWNFYMASGISFSVSSNNIGAKYSLGGFGWTSGGIDLTEIYFLAYDYNGDNKTDILKIFNHTRRCVGSLLGGCDYNYDGTPHETVFKICENKGLNSNGDLLFNSTISEMQTASVFRYPIIVYNNHNSPNKSTDIAFISNNKIQVFESYKENKIDIQLKKITTGNGVAETITYKPLKYENCGTDCNSVYYDSGYTENYPNTDILVAPTFNVVTQIEKQSVAVFKKQQFMYYGAVSNMNGLGFLGFRATMRTNWTDLAGTNLISSISKNDISLRGTNVESYTIKDFYLPQNLTLISNFISKTVSTYNIDNTTGVFQDPLQTNKVFKLKNTKSETFNGLDNTSAITTTEFDVYKNPTQSTTTLKNADVVEQITVSSIGYEPPSTLPPYVLGRPSSKINTITIYPNTSNEDVSSTEENYTYQNSLLFTVKKRNTNSGVTSNYIKEINDFDNWGNITKKTISYPGLADRVTEYVYDEQSHRFLIQTYDIEHLLTEYTYDTNSGVLLTEKLPSNQGYPLITTYEYDKWFKKIKITDYLGQKKEINYSREDEKTRVTTRGNDDSHTTELFDDLGRKIQTGVRNISGNFSYISHEYDIYDRNYKVSEPYFDANTTPSLLQWNQTFYDDYGRVSKNSSFRGNITEIVYNGLTTSVNQFTNSTLIKTKISTKNAIGQMISTTDATPMPTAETIDYTYFANGNLKTTSYNDAITTITQDEWGRKLSLNDPSAGLYQYTYNGLGETLTEKTPKGITTYLLDDWGKVLTKTIVGDLTNTKTTHTYDPNTKLLTNTLFEDFLVNEGQTHTTNYTYEYDNYKRLWRTGESNPQFYFQRATIFDLFGRSKLEYYHATNLSDNKVINKWIANTYLNGYHWQIRDAGTNGSDTNGLMLWQTDAVNARGQLLTAKYGNGIGQELYTYDAFGMPKTTTFKTQIGNYASSTPFMSLGTTFDPQRGNLISRNFSFNNAQENFIYDELDRLTEYPNASGTLVNQSYDAQGKITNNDLGEYRYDNNKPYRNIGIKLSTPEILSYYSVRTPQVITYNAIKKPVKISEFNREKIDFEYNAAGSRSAMYYGDFQTDKNVRKLRKFYAADGSMEIKSNVIANTVEFVVYIGGDGYSAPLVFMSNGSVDSEKYLYLHRDYQGSIVAISDGTGQVLEKRAFDAWGSLAKYWNISGVLTLPTTAGDMLLDRGYTGHEHILGLGLINMNGRLYDPKLHRFLSPDNYVQDPSNTQNYNRYGYCWNNPLKFTDPSGELLWFVPLIYAAVNLGVDMAMNNGKMNFGQIAMSLGQGALSGALGGATSVGGAFLGAGLGQLNRFMPAIPLYQSAGFNLSISPFIGFGSSGFAGGVNLNASGQVGDFAYSASVGVGFNSGTSSLGESSGGSGFWNAGGFAGYNDGHANYGLGYSYNSFGGKTGQGVGAVTIQAGDFGLRIDEDAFIGDNGDRSRTGGMLMTYRVNGDLTLAFGASMMTGEATGDDDHTQGNPNYYKKGPMTGQMVGTHRGEINPTLRAGTMYGGAIYKGQASFYGHNSEKRLHSVQNYIHKNMVHYTPYFADRGLASRPYSYSGSYHSSYLYY